MKYLVLAPRLSRHTAALAALLSLTTIGSGAFASQAPAVTTFKVGEPHALPTDAFMAEDAINPLTRNMRAGVAAGAPSALPSAAPDAGVQVGQAAPSYRTLGDAAKAGVNPMAAPQAVLKASKNAAIPHGVVKPWWPYALAGLGFLVVIFGAYFVFTKRAQSLDSEE
jgi:hypothetical protein